ncbi:helicase-related protein [Bacillus alkalicellulosilyticus]|uniref:helicase-related protein n=1 Tax=Alkalihalobacterium alkalicellulosilyticum TaxID=1912214 RepID=UPI000998576A|nr:helicase-related protein [Bacillus alkalicellulosilyticus]
MSQLDFLYPHAIDHTKKKVLEDIDSFLGEKNQLHSFKDYLEERNHYVEQIWINVWVTKASNGVSKKEKRMYVKDRGFDVEGIDKKTLNRLFRTEIKHYRPFQVIPWLTKEYADSDELWEERYKSAREQYLKRQEEEMRARAINEVQEQIIKYALATLEQNHNSLYLQLRQEVAKRIAGDLEVNGSPVEDYETVADFFSEITGDEFEIREWGDIFVQEETFHDIYEIVISEIISTLSLNLIMSTLPNELLQKYKEVNNNHSFTKGVLNRLMSDSLYGLYIVFFSDIQDELITDLLELPDVPFDQEKHKAIYEQHLVERERKKEERLREQQLQAEREERMLEDIFGREYSPSPGRSISYVLHIGETNTGKTFQALERMKKAASGIYLAPLRLLALEVYDKLNHEGVPCSLKTGEEEKEVEGAQHSSCTVEMFHEKEFYDVVVIDEAQMIADKDRGFSWYKAITKANATEVHIIGSRNSKNMILQLLGASKIEVRDYKREIPLEVEGNPFSIKDTQKGDALVCFSRRRVLETAARLQNDRHSVSMIYGSMPPETRQKQMQRFLDGETTVIVATDAIGMGLNLPIRRIVFLENEKFDGTRRRRLNSQEVKQIAGRAGRKGIYNVGKVAFTQDIRQMKKLLHQDDEPVHTFAIAPTKSVLERFQKYSRDLGMFFELWKMFKSPKGTKKASLYEERELYELIKETEIEARLSLQDLYGFLHLPFSGREQGLIEQWQETMYAIVKGKELPEPVLKRSSLEEQELSYKAVGLHLLFLYRLNRKTEALYWERVRQEISDEVHESLKSDVRTYAKKCKKCGKKLDWDHQYPICDSCHYSRSRRWMDDEM